jgi:hypothetical protein
MLRAWLLEHQAERPVTTRRRPSSDAPRSRII